LEVNLESVFNAVGHVVSRDAHLRCAALVRTLLFFVRAIFVNVECRMSNVGPNLTLVDNVPAGAAIKQQYAKNTPTGQERCGNNMRARITKSTVCIFYRSVSSRQLHKKAPHDKSLINQNPYKYEFVVYIILLTSFFCN